MFQQLQKYLTTLCVIALPLLVNSSLLAQTREDRVAADATFARGKELLEQGRVSEACRNLKASAQLLPGVGVLLYLGDCYQVDGRFESARRSFESAKRLAAKRGDEERREIASVRAKALIPRTPVLQLMIPKERQIQLRLLVNGKNIPQKNWHRPQRYDAGEVVVVVRAPDHLPWTERVTLINDDGPRIVNVPPLVPLRKSSVQAQTPKPSAPDQSDDTLRTWAYLLGGTGLVSLGVSVVLSLEAHRLNKEADCPDPGCQSPADVQQVRDARQLASFATIFGVSGTVLGVTGTSLLLAAPKSDSGDTGFYIGLRGSL